MDAAIIMNKYPADLIVTIQDFTDSGCNTLLAGSTRVRYSSIWQTLSEAARKAIEDDCPGHGKVLWLLADACSMMLRPSNPNAPFKPMFIIDGKRSALPEDFTVADIEFFSAIVDIVDNIYLKARLADLVWLLKRPRDPRFALIAIDAYRSLPIELTIWIEEGRACFERAARLSTMLGTGAGERRRQIEAALLARFETTSCSDGYLGFWIAEMLESIGFGRTHREKIGLKLELLGNAFDESGDLHRSKDYFQASAHWHGKAGQVSSQIRMLTKLAESWVKEAEISTSGENASNMVAGTFIENAIQVYRSIPHHERSPYLVDERIAELHSLLSESGSRALYEMGVHSTPGVDISHIVAESQGRIRGKELTAALMSFISFHHGITVEKLRDEALELISRFPLQSLFASVHYSRDGRVVAKTPGVNTSDIDSPETMAAIWSQMMKNYQLTIGLMVQGSILPALEMFQLEHRMPEYAFVALCERSQAVPPGRERLVAKGLLAGFDNDFMTAMHILAPQFEHFVRFQLKLRGVKTTNLDSNGIENENGLSSLLENAEVTEIFGANTVFEIKALFTDPLGPNLRNEIAHGLIDFSDGQILYAIYAWWFYLKIIMKVSGLGGSSQSQNCDEQRNIPSHEN